MDRMHLMDRFDLQSQCFLDDHIHLVMFVEGSSLVGHRDALLADKWQPGCGKFVAQAGLIHAFQQSRTELPMHLDRATDYASGKSGAGYRLHTDRLLFCRGYRPRWKNRVIPPVSAGYFRDAQEFVVRWDEGPCASPTRFL